MTPDQPERKFVQSTNARSFLDRGYEQVSGWLMPEVFSVVDCVVSLLRESGHEWRDSLETGVHEGKFLIPLELVTPSERAVIAVDLFGSQEF